MSDEHNAREGMGNQFYDEAADWFTKMRGPDADAHRADFEAWLKRGALHRAAYNRIAEIFLDSDATEDSQPGPATRMRWRLLPALCVIVLAALCALSLSYMLAQPDRGDVHAENRSRRAGTSVPRPSAYSTIVGEVRPIKLEDGSRVTLDTDSLLSIDFSSTERRLRLIRGRARFEVAHERRPFRVAAGLGVITARGTIFDVRVEADKVVSVQLLRGAIDVNTKAKATHPLLLPQVQHLRPGQGTSYTDQFATAQPIERLSDTRWPSSRAEFDDVPLGEVIIEANRYSLVPIELEEDHLAKLKVSGVFSLRHTQNVAEKLAHLFNLRVSREPYRILLSKPKGPSPE